MFSGMYPIMFEQIYKETVWGGDGLKRKYGRSFSGSNIGESWDVSCREKEMSVIENGTLKGVKFKDAIQKSPAEILGINLFQRKDFPLLLKIIDAKSNLSVQVHPGDKYANKIENYPYGKKEMWYILEAPKNAYLIIGTKDNVTKQDFKKAALDGKIEPLLGRLSVKPGDVINIPSGLIHAITGGIILAEIQQNSDITYRIYDYGRLGLDGKPRELHIEKSLDVIDFDGKINKSAVEGLAIEFPKVKKTYYIANSYFAVEKYEIKESLTEATDGNKFLIFTCVEGNAAFSANGISAEVAAGRCVFIPAGLGEFNITGSSSLIKSYVPNIERDFVEPLIAAGYSTDEIERYTEIDRGTE